LPIENLAEDTIRSFIQVNQATIIFFSASWCGPCKMMEQILAELNLPTSPAVAIGRVEIDANRALAEKFEITGVPTTIVYSRGKQVVFSTPEGNIERIIGVISKETFLKIIEQVGSSSK
jgi:thioredoxin 1